MAIARLTAQDTKASATTGTVVGTYPSTPTPGNLCIATTWNAQGSDVAPAVGENWLLLTGDLAGNNASIKMDIFFKVAGAAEPKTFTYSVGANASRLHMYEYSGTDTDSATVARAFNEGNSGATTVTSQTTNAVSAIAGDLLFAMAGTATAYTGTGAWTNSFTLLQQDTGLRMFDGQRIIAADGSYSTAGSWTTTNKATAFIVAFRPLQVAAAGFTGWGVPIN